MTTPSSSHPAPLTYAERAKQAQAKKDLRNGVSSKDTTANQAQDSPTMPSNSSPSTAQTPALSESIPSSASSVNGASQFSPNNDGQDTMGTPASSVATPSIPDVTDDQETFSKPASKPPVNVWALRKEQMGATEKPSQETVTSIPVAPSNAADKPRFGTGSGISRRKDDPTRPGAAARSSHPLQSIRRTGVNSAIAIGIVGSSQAVSKSSAGKSNQAPLPSPSDSSMWPSPSTQIEQSTSQKENGRSVSSGSAENSQTGEIVDGKKGKKAKWIPIQVDLNVKTSSASLAAAARTADGKRGGSTDRKRADKPQPTSSGSRAETVQGGDSSKAGRKAVRNGNQNPTTVTELSTRAHPFEIPKDSPLPNGGLPVDEKAAPSPVFHYDGKSSSKNKTESAPGVSSSISGANGINGHAEQGEGVEGGHARFETAPSGQHISSNGQNRPRGGRGGFFPSRGRGNANFGNNNFSRSGLSSHQYGSRFANNFLPNSPPSPNPANLPNGFSTSPPVHSGVYMPYPEIDPYYMQQQQQQAYMGGYNPYAPMQNFGYSQNGYSSMPYQDFNSAMQPAAHNRPIPMNAHLLMDPPMNPTAYWILGQIEFYMTEDNLARDVFLREQMDAEGWISIAMIATFKRVAALSNDLLLVQSAVQRSTELEVDGDLMRRRNDWTKWVMPAARPARSAPPLSDGAIALQQAAAANLARSPPQQSNVLSPQYSQANLPSQINQANHVSHDITSDQTGSRQGLANGSTEPSVQSTSKDGPATEAVSTAGASPLQIALKVQPSIPQLAGPAAQPTFAIGVGATEKRERSSSLRQNLAL